jgi:hypothetical protein
MIFWVSISNPFAFWIILLTSPIYPQSSPLQ